MGETQGHERQASARVDSYTLDSGHGLAATIWTYGATLVEVLAPDACGRRDNVVLRLPRLRDYETTRHYVGSTVGRYARCVAGASFSLDGVVYELERNRGRHHLHGGRFGFDRFVWEAEPSAETDAVCLRLRLERPAGDEGYPGAVEVETTYLVSATTLTIKHHARTTAPTIIDVTNHAYWNLAGEGTIDAHELAISARRVLLVDDDLIPVRSPKEVSGTVFDYSRRRLLGASRLDHCFLLDDRTWVAELHDPQTRRMIRVATGERGLQVYSGDALPCPRAGLTLQTGSLPNAPNRPDFPSCRLDPGEMYEHVTVHEFSTA